MDPWHHLDPETRPGKPIDFIGLNKGIPTALALAHKYKAISMELARIINFEVWDRGFCVYQQQHGTNKQARQ